MLIMPRRAQKGQAKPWASIPRINWAHPLTYGLVFYGYDLGGRMIDLVGGSVGIIGAGGSQPDRIITPFGYGTSWTGLAANGTEWSFPNVINPSLTISNAPYSYACGFYETARPATLSTSVCFALATAGNFAVLMAPDQAANGDFTAFFGVSAASTINIGSGNTLNTFNSAIAVANSASTGTLFLNTASSSAAGMTNTGTLAGAVPLFNSFEVGGADKDFTGTVFYGAIWQPRAITQSEALSIYTDPYQFLIYPEDDVLSSWVGTAGAAAKKNFPPFQLKAA
jgi:hypothetical protein